MIQGNDTQSINGSLLDENIYRSSWIPITKLSDDEVEEAYEYLETIEHEELGNDELCDVFQRIAYYDKVLVYIASHIEHTMSMMNVFILRNILHIKRSYFIHYLIGYKYFKTGLYHLTFNFYIEFNHSMRMVFYGVEYHLKLKCNSELKNDTMLHKLLLLH